MPGLNLTKILGNVFTSKSAEVAVKAVEKESTVLSKEMPKIVEGLSPSQTLAFGAPNLPTDSPRHYFCDLLTDAFEKSNNIDTLKAANSPKYLIQHAYNKLPIKVLPQNAIPKAFTLPKVQEKIKDTQIKMLLEKIERAQREKNEVLKRLEHDFSHTKFADAKISDPDEILELINSGKYGNHEIDMLKALSKTGTPEHAEKLLDQLGDVPVAINDKFCGDPYSFRIATIAAIGNDAQKASLASRLDKSLTTDHSKHLKKAIFNGVSQVGKNNPKDEHFLNLLLKQTNNSHNRALAYEHLSNFEDQFDVIHKGLMQFPESKEILISAYRAAKSPEQKELLLKSIVENPGLRDTAIDSSASIFENDLAENYKYDIISKFAQSNEILAKLSNYQRESIYRQLKLN